MLLNRIYFLSLLLFFPAILEAVSVQEQQVIRIYVSGESVEEFNNMNIKSFEDNGSLFQESNNSSNEYGWMVPLSQRLHLRDPGLSIEWVGSGCWSNQDTWECSTARYTNAQIGHSSAQAGSTIEGWRNSHLQELTNKLYCYDIAFASRGGNDLANDISAQTYKAQLRELILDLDSGSNCRTHPVIYVTGHILDTGGWNYGETEEAIGEWMNIQKAYYVNIAKRVSSELNANGRHVFFIDMWTPFYSDKHTTAFPAETWWFVNQYGVRIPDLDKIHRDREQHPRRLASIFAGENVADQIDIDMLRHILFDTGKAINPALIMYLLQ